MNNPIPLDVRDTPKERAQWLLFRAEMLYLRSRGWEMVCGVTNNYMVKPGEDYRLPEAVLYSHEEALKIQKESDARP